jgi:hypothetical protein
VRLTYYFFRVMCDSQQIEWPSRLHLSSIVSLPMTELQRCVRQDNVPAATIAALPTSLLEQRALGAGKQNDHIYAMLARNLEQKSNVRPKKTSPMPGG